MLDWFLGIFSKPLGQFTLMDVGGIALLLAIGGLIFAVISDR